MKWQDTVLTTSEQEKLFVKWTEGDTTTKYGDGLLKAQAEKTWDIAYKAGIEAQKAVCGDCETPVNKVLEAEMNDIRLTDEDLYGKSRHKMGITRRSIADKATIKALQKIVEWINTVKLSGFYGGCGVVMIDGALWQAKLAEWGIDQEKGDK